ncbi:MAG TPA: LpxD N-terminal domain-containing protein, partial [Enterovirga sp.]|nr:LpxD N-terminal domain-containing protein [Enterovirga sp.]
MADPIFFPVEGGLTLGEIAALVSAPIPEGQGARVLGGVAPLEEAGPNHLAYMDNARYGDALAATRAGAVLVSRRFAAKVPEGSAALVVADPHRAYAAVLARLHPSALRPGSGFGTVGITPGSFVHPAARLEHGVTVDPGAVVGPRAEIGSGTVIGAGAVIGPDVRIGRDCSIGPTATVLAALI